MMTREEVMKKQMGGLINILSNSTQKAIDKAMRMYAQQEVENALNAASSNGEISLKMDDGISDYYINTSRYFNNKALKDAVSAEINKESILNAYKIPE